MQAFGDHFDARSETRWRHSRPGRMVHWERILADVLGDSWRDLTTDRRYWRSCRQHFVYEACCRLLGTGHKAFGCRAAPLPPAQEQMVEAVAPSVVAWCPSESDRGWHKRYSLETLEVPAQEAQVGLRWLRAGVPIQFIGNSKIVIDCFLGRASASPSLRHPLQVAHLGLSELTCKVAVRAPFGKEIAQQTPRSDNAAADSCANRSLDRSNFWEFHSSAIRQMIQGIEAASLGLEVGLLVAFDGASRGNPVPASLGVSVWWRSWSAEGFMEGGLLLQVGRRIGKASNNIAEANALARATKELLHLVLNLAWYLSTRSKVEIQGNPWSRL